MISLTLGKKLVFYRQMGCSLLKESWQYFGVITIILKLAFSPQFIQYIPTWKLSEGIAGERDVVSLEGSRDSCNIDGKGWGGLEWYQTIVATNLSGQGLGLTTAFTRISRRWCQHLLGNDDYNGAYFIGFSGPQIWQIRKTVKNHGKFHESREQRSKMTHLADAVFCFSYSGEKFPLRDVTEVKTHLPIPTFSSLQLKTLLGVSPL